MCVCVCVCMHTAQFTSLPPPLPPLSLPPSFHLSPYSYRGGLDVCNDQTGETSIYTEYKDRKIMFHVSTLLPLDPTDTQHVSGGGEEGEDNGMWGRIQAQITYCSNNLTYCNNYVGILHTVYIQSVHCIQINCLLHVDTHKLFTVYT